MASNKQRFFDMYASYVMKDLLPEADAIFQSEFEYFRNILVDVLTRIMAYQVSALLLYEHLSNVFGEFHGLFDRMVEDLDNPKALPTGYYYSLSETLKVFLPNYDMYEHYIKILNNIKTDNLYIVDFDMTKEEAAYIIWVEELNEKLHKVLRSLFNNDGSGVSKKPPNITLSEFPQYFSVVDFGSQPWVEVAKLTQEVDKSSGSAAFQAFDRLIDFVHHQGNLIDFIVRELSTSFLTKDVLDFRANAKLEDYLPYVSSDVRKLIREYNSMFRTSYQKIAQSPQRAVFDMYVTNFIENRTNVPEIQNFAQSLQHNAIDLLRKSLIKVFNKFEKDPPKYKPGKIISGSYYNLLKSSNDIRLWDGLIDQLHQHPRLIEEFTKVDPSLKGWLSSQFFNQRAEMDVNEMIPYTSSEVAKLMQEYKRTGCIYKLRDIQFSLRKAFVVDAIKTVLVTLEDLVNSSVPSRKTRSTRCSSNLIRFDPETGIAHFATRCPGSKSGSWRQKLQFDDWENFKEVLGFAEEELEEELENEILEEEEENESQIVNAQTISKIEFQDVIKRAKEKGLKFFTKVNCSCPSFSFDGYAYMAHELGYGWPPIVDEPPSEKNPQMVGALCKHLLSVYDHYFK